MAPISMVTWNLLAPTFATPAKYPWATREHLDWKSRQAKIVSRLAEIDADVICLQEVEVALWVELRRRLTKFGYDGIIQEISRGHPVANAVCVRKSILSIDRAESRSRALLTVLRACDEPGAGQRATRSAAARQLESVPPLPSPLYLANVHLEAGAEKGATRLAQMSSLLRRVELQRAMDVADAQGRKTVLSPDCDTTGAALVIAGDFNSDRSSELHSFLATGTPPGADHTHKRASARRLLLPLRDAYLGTPAPWGPPLRSSYRNGRLLDFVWTSPAVEVLRTMPTCELSGSNRPHQLPSAEHPSDHLPIGALLSWSGEPSGAAVARTGVGSLWQQLYVENVQWPVQRQQPRQRQR